MRIVAGTLKGRLIATPRGRVTRPTTDRVREALFSVITSRAPGLLDNAYVLDAFAGSGALGLEALSRGAGHATFVESNRSALAVLARNIESLGVSDLCTVVCGDVLAESTQERFAAHPASLLFLDPPYRICKAKVTALVHGLTENGTLDLGALMVWEHDHTAGAVWPLGCEPIVTKRYGTTVIEIARWTGRDDH